MNILEKRVFEQVSNMFAIIGVVVCTTLAMNYTNDSHTRSIVLEELAKRDAIHQVQHQHMIAAMMDFSAKASNVAVVRHEVKNHKGAKQ